jgi:hypothetical protein
MIIGFCGVIGAGKTTAARHLVDHWGFVRVRFADQLKSMLRTLGLSAEEVDGSLKDRPSTLLCGKTPRFAMQRLGTEFGRDLIGADLWVNAWRAKTFEHENVVADDVRFPNEVAAIAWRGTLIRVVRPGHDAASDHISERHALDEDLTLLNSGDVTALCARLDQMMTLLGQAHREAARG